jgi:hypothetical protein
MNGEHPSAAIQESREAIMENLGIVRIPADVYHYRQYRYSRFEDAVAQQSGI